MAAMSDFRDVTSLLRDFSSASMSARVGSAMAAVDLCGDGDSGGWLAAVDEWSERVGKDRRDRDTRLSRALNP